MNITEEDFHIFCTSNDCNNIKKQDCIVFNSNLNQQSEQICNDNSVFDPNISKVIETNTKGSGPYLQI